MIAAGFEMREYGKVLFTIGDRDKEEALSLARRFSDIGYGLVATEGTRRFLEEHGLKAQGVEKIGEGEETVLDVIRGRKVQFVVNTFSVAKRDFISDGFPHPKRVRGEQHSLPHLTGYGSSHFKCTGIHELFLWKPIRRKSMSKVMKMKILTNESIAKKVFRMKLSAEEVDFKTPLSRNLSQHQSGQRDGAYAETSHLHL